MSLRLKRTLDYLLKYYGHDILLQRKVGNKFSDTLERHTVRHWLPGSPTDTMHLQPEGLIVDVDMIYAAKAEMKPKENDRIYERDEGLGQQTTFIIDYAVPMRGAKGEVTFWKVGATREELN